MSNTFLDIRQSQTRILQDQLNVNSTQGMDSTLASINNELTPPGRLIATYPPSLVVTVGAGTVINPNTNKNRVLPFINNIPVSFNGGTITFPSTSGTITVNPGTNANITIGANQFVAVLVQLNTAGQIGLIVGAPATSLNAVVIPSGSTFSLSLGYIIVQSNSSSVIQNITNTMLYQFVGGGGSGNGFSNADSLLEDLKNQLVDSYYQFLSGQSFAQSQSLIDVSNTTAIFNNQTNSYVFTTGQKITTINLLDPGFSNLLKDIDEALVTLRYISGSVDPAPTVQLSRDNGVTWQTVNVSQNDGSDELSGIIDFADETLTQSPSYTVNSNEVLNTTSQYKLAQIFTVPANTLLLVQQFTFNITKIGSPGGSLIIKLVKQNGGQPSLQVSDIINIVNLNIASLSSGAVTINFGKQILSSGNYYLLFETDTFYSNSFSSGVNEIDIGTNTGSPNALAYNGTTWSTISGVEIPYSYTYKNIALKLQVTASTSSALVAFGVFYQKLTDLVSPVSYDQIIVGSANQVSAGLATHSSLQAGLNDVGFATRIKFLAVTVTENVTMSQSKVVIEGDGINSVLYGNLTISGEYNIIEDLQIYGNLTISGNANFFNNIVVVGGVITNTGVDNNLNILWVTSDAI